MLHAALFLRRWLAWALCACVVIAIALAAANGLDPGVRASAATGAGGALLSGLWVLRRRTKLRDAVTGLMGSEIFESCRQSLVRRARPHRPLALIMVTIDAPGGDDALTDHHRRQSAEALVRAIDERDHAFTTGPTCFVVACARVNRTSVATYGARLRSTVHASLPPYLAIEARVRSHVTIVMGVDQEDTSGRASGAFKWLAAVTRSRPSRLEA
jgi:GGDEF domain-containing protein